jgi:hypothetical protein
MRFRGRRRMEGAMHAAASGREWTSSTPGILTVRKSGPGNNYGGKVWHNTCRLRLSGVA